MAFNGHRSTLSSVTLAAEIPSFEAGLLAFLFVFILMGIMFYVLRSERDKQILVANPLGPSDTVSFENPLSRSDAPFLAIMTLVILELAVDALTVISAFRGMGSAGIGTMLAIAAFLAAAILWVYRDAYMSESYTRKPRLEIIAAQLLEETNRGERHD